MHGVNAELMPLMRMTFPPDAGAIEALPTGQVAFASWLLLFGVVPVDRHDLCIERVLPGTGFDERSHSLMQRVWIHRRRIEPLSEGCRVSDELMFEPRLIPMRALTRRIVRGIFEHRHRRLRRRFGELG